MTLRASTDLAANVAFPSSVDNAQQFTDSLPPIAVRHEFIIAFITLRTISNLADGPSRAYDARVTSLPYKFDEPYFPI